MAKIGFIDDHSRDKGAERKRQPHQVGEVTDPERHREGKDEEKLTRAQPRNVEEEPRHELGAHEEHEEEEQRRIENRPEHLIEVQLRPGELGKDEHHGDNRQILHDKHAEHDPAAQRRAIRNTTERLHDDDRARDRNEASKPERFAPVQAERVREQDAGDAAERKLDDGACGCHGGNFPKLADGEFESDGKQKQPDADLGEALNHVDVLHGHSARVRPDDDARGNVAKEQRLPKPSRNERPAKGGKNDVDKVGGNSHAASIAKRARVQYRSSQKETGTFTPAQRELHSDTIRKVTTQPAEKKRCFTAVVFGNLPGWMLHLLYLNQNGSEDF